MRSRSRRFAQVALTVACTGCGDAPPAGPAHATHPMVGRYELRVIFSVYRADVRRAELGATDATLGGMLVIADTVELRGTTVFFPDVRLDATFCPTRATCGARQSYSAFTTLFGPQLPVTLGFSGAGGVPTLHLEGPFDRDSITGTAYYQVGTARYDGVFAAGKR
jgi:hypothetical protein